MQRTIVGFTLAIALLLLAQPSSAAALEALGVREPGKSSHREQVKAEPTQRAVSGQVLGNGDKPLSGVFVQQLGGIASAITDEGGKYTIRLDSGAGQVLVFTAVGYLANQRPADAPGPLSLEPIPTYRPAFVPAQEDQDAALPEKIVDTQIGMRYRHRNEALAARSRGVEGWSNNEFEVDARYRADNLLLVLSGFRNRTPITIVPLTSQPAQQPATEATQWTGSLGYVVELGDFDLVPKATFTSAWGTPSNGGTPWTGTPLDYSTTRQGLGLELEGATRFEDLTLAIKAGVFPNLATTLSGAPYAVSDIRSFDIGLLVGYEIFPGLRADFTASRQFASGLDFDHWANVFGIGLTYLPLEVRP